MGKEANSQVLFICQANVGRSQMAEGFWNDLVGVPTATSAGLVDLAAKYNGHPAPIVTDVMQEVGIDISGQIVKQVTQEMVEGVEHVVVLCTDEPPVFVAESPKTIYRFIPDPYMAGLEGTRESRDQIRKVVETLRRDGFSPVTL